MIQSLISMETFRPNPPSPISSLWPLYCCMQRKHLVLITSIPLRHAWRLPWLVHSPCSLARGTDCAAPPEVVASWPKPNYTNPETRGPALFITCTALSAIGLIVVAARLYARLVITKAPGLDDGIIVVALLLGIGSSIVSIYATGVLYIGHHVWDVPATAFAAIRLNSWLGQWFSNGVLSAVKISILLFYRRLSVTFSNRFLWATWIGIGYNIGKKY